MTSPPVGSTVKLRRTRTTGIVEKVSGDWVELLVGSVRMRARMSEVELSAPTSKKEETTTRSKPYTLVADSRHTPESIDLHGLRVHEALLKTEEAIDRALLAGLSRLSIIHGVGMGKIMDALDGLLPQLPSVAHFARDTKNPGVTHVYFHAA